MLCVKFIHVIYGFRRRVSTMTEKRKVVVKINGQEITVIGNESAEYIKSIAEFVDEKICETQSKNSKLSQSMSAILTAFNIADQYYKNYVELTDLKEEIKEPLKELEELREKMKEYKAEKAKLIEESDDYKEQVYQLNKELEKKNKTLKRQEQALEFKEDEIQKSEKIIGDLQNKLFENQLELVQTKKELDEFIKTLDETEPSRNKSNI